MVKDQVLCFHCGKEHERLMVFKFGDGYIFFCGECYDAMVTRVAERKARSGSE